MNSNVNVNEIVNELTNINSNLDAAAGLREMSNPEIFYGVVFGI